MFPSIPRLPRLASLLVGIGALLSVLSPALGQEPAPAASPPSQEQSQPAQPAPPPSQNEGRPKDDTPPPSLVYSEKMAQEVSQLTAAMENAEKAVERVKDRDGGLAEQRNETERIEAKAIELAGALRTPLQAVKAQLEKLGPAPKDNAAEAPSVATERARLSAVQTDMEGAIKTAELIQVRARQLIGRVQNLRQANFARDLLRRSPSLLSQSAWQSVSREVPRAWGQITGIATSWWADAKAHAFALAVVLLAAGTLPIAIGRFMARLLRRRTLTASKPSPFFRRTRSAGVTFLAHALPLATAAGIVYAGMLWLDLLTFPVGNLAETVLMGVLFYVVITALAAAILKPCPATHRMLTIPDASVSKLFTLARCFAALFAIDYILTGVARILFLPFEIGVVQASLSSLAFAALLIGFVSTPIVAPRETDIAPPDPLAPSWLKLPLAGLAAAIVVTTLLGFVSLGRFIGGQVTLVGAAALALLLAHLSFRNIAEQISGSERGVVLENRLGLDRERTNYFSQILVFIFDTALVLVAIPVLLLTWGFAGDDILDWLKVGMFGFEVGQVRISLVRILLAAALFLIVVSGTRIVQRWLDRSILQPARVDSAISHSVLMGIGYAGIGAAALAALSYAGLDFTHLAIVAGALSVGIGFGLQAIFNNFVSGIILLVERPIKVGDWIIVNGREGFVRRINVRATEIETFDRASVIVPNSSLITGEVTNLTHRNAMGRVLLKIGVSYKADPENVIKILKGVAEKSTSVLKLPGPWVGFDSFGADAMVFTVVAFVADVSQRGNVQSELLIGINKAFREAGIEIPYPQHDIHLRDLDGVRQILAAAMEARRQEKDIEADEPT